VNCYRFVQRVEDSIRKAFAIVLNSGVLIIPDLLLGWNRH
jgi:hypothetical protein